MKTFFRIFFTLCLLAIVAMVYWSSLLVEEDLKNVKKELAELKKELQFNLNHFSFSQNTSKPISRPHIDSQYPNLLTEDPYYKTLLPTILGPNFQPKGVRREAILGKPDHLHPFNNFKDIALMISQCSGSLAQPHFGKYESYSPFLAIKIEKRPREDIEEAFEYWIHLRENVYWEPLQAKHFPKNFSLSPHFLERHLVTAKDFKFYYDAIMNPYVLEPKAGALRRAYADIESFEIIDDFTFKVRWKAEKIEDKEYKVKYTSLSLTLGLQPLACFVYQYFADGNKIIDDENYSQNSIFAENFSNHFAKNIIVSCGPYIFNGINDEMISFVRNPKFYDPYAVLIEEYQIKFKESVDAIWQDFRNQKIDLCILPPQLQNDYQAFLKSPTYASQTPVSKIEYLDRSYFYIGWNEKKPFFQNKQVRLALTLAIDRNRIIEQNLNQMGIILTGPFFPYSPSYNPAILPHPFDPDLAISILEKEGWYDKDGDGIREKIINNEKHVFRFPLLYYVKSVSTKVICEFIATSLKRVGIDCELYGVDLPDLSRNFEDKSFDALFMGWGLGTPPEDPEQLWHSSLAVQKGSSNAIGFANKEADQIIEKLHYEYDVNKRNDLYHKFHTIIYDEAPYTFLYSPKRSLIYRDHLKNIVIPTEIMKDAEASEPEFRALFIK